MICCPWDGALVGRDRCTGCDRGLDPEWTTCPWCRTAVAQRATVPVPRPRPATGRPRLLVVDDDPSVRHFVTAALSGSVDVLTADSAADALQLLGTQHFDGALVDNMLPDLTGVELMRLIRNDPRTLTLPVVLFTGVGSASIEQEALQAGADDFLRKPIEPTLLEERMLAVLERESRPLPTNPPLA
jgi:CheY-like chemotaxis protein